MLEVCPQFTYLLDENDSSNNVLKITARLEDQFGINDEDQKLAQIARESWEQSIDQISSEDGVEVDYVGDAGTLAVNVDQRFANSFKKNDNSDIVEFLAQLNRIMPRHPTDSIDRVVGLELPNYYGSIGVIYQHFQRWLNSQSLDEVVAKQAVIALAQPFGADVVKKASKDFYYYAGGGALAEGYTSKIVVQKQPFRVVSFEETEDEHIQKAGLVEWYDVSISTLGSCACWGVGWSGHEIMFKSGDSKRLYDLKPHNVDTARQALSHILGIGVLAFYAAQYQGDEDILADTNWGEPRVYPKTS